MAKQTEEFGKIIDLVQDYLDGIYEGAVEKLKSVMHQDARMISLSEDSYSNIGMDEYFDIVEKRRSPKESNERRMDKLLSINAKPEGTACVELECLVLGKYCKDTLTLVKVQNQWQIVSKVFAYELIEG